uniref:Uncharacterized protein n=2 Tax=Physcomitrium patens TaxID=3218 RepID=A0A7I4CLJ2_PHYPA
MDAAADETSFVPVRNSSTVYTLFVPWLSLPSAVNAQFDERDSHEPMFLAQWTNSSFKMLDFSVALPDFWFSLSFSYFDSFMTDIRRNCPSQQGTHAFEPDLLGVKPHHERPNPHGVLLNGPSPAEGHPCHGPYSLLSVRRAAVTGVRVKRADLPELRGRHARKRHLRIHNSKTSQRYRMLAPSSSWGRTDIYSHLHQWKQIIHSSSSPLLPQHRHGVPRKL